MTFSLSAAEIDTAAARSSAAECLEIVTVFREESKAAADEAKAAAWRLLADLLEMHFLPEERFQPFGPARTFGSQRTIIPDDLTPEQLDALQVIIPVLKTAEVQARLADIVWLRKKHADSARIAAAAYLAAAQKLDDEKLWMLPMQRYERALRLCRSIGAGNSPVDAIVAAIVAVADKYRGEDRFFMTGRALELMLEFRFGDPAICIQYAERGAATQRTLGNLDMSRSYLELQAKWEARRGSNDGEAKARLAIGASFVEEATMRETGGDHAAAVHFLTSAIEAYRRAPGGRAEVDGLRQRLQRAEQASLAQFRAVETQIDCSDLIEASQKYVAGYPKEDAIRRFANVSPLTNVDNARRRVLEMAKKSPLQFLLSRVSVDSEGRTVSKLPSALGGDVAQEEEAVFGHMIEQSKRERGLKVEAQIIPAFEQLLLEHEITRKDVGQIVGYSAFVPHDRRAIFSAGLWAGFNQEFATALHMLMPQVENSIRHMLHGRGMITTSLKDGIQREVDLNGLVVDPRVKAMFDASIIFELRSLFTDQRGSNFRNLLAHGMLADDAFESAEAIYAWWLILRLCLSIRYVPAPEVKPEARPAAPA